MWNQAYHDLKIHIDLHESWPNLRVEACRVWMLQPFPFYIFLPLLETRGRRMASAVYMSGWLAYSSPYLLIYKMSLCPSLSISHPLSQAVFLRKFHTRATCLWYIQQAIYHGLCWIIHGRNKGPCAVNISTSMSYIDVHDEDKIRDTLYAEIKQVLQRLTGASIVHIWSHVVT